MSFGQSHRQLVEDTNKGIVEPTSSERATSQAQVGARETKHLGGEHEGLAALVNLADTAAKPMIAEANRKKERDAYDNAGTEEGKKVADSAADVWHNRLFGSDASLRGAQKRIAEDNSRRIYLEAQDLLANGGADGWDDKKWKEWKDKQIEDEVNKYESEGMKDFINSSMGRDFQNLERDRTWRHQEYLHAENRKSTQQGVDTLFKTFNDNRGSGEPNRSEEDAAKQIDQIKELQKDSGVSEQVFASILAQAASDDLTGPGNREFYEQLKEEGFFEALDFSDQQRLQSALDINEIKTSEEFNRQHQAIYGPTGFAARGDINGAVAAFDSLADEFPTAFPAGARNELKNHVREVARVNAEQARHQKELLQHSKEMADTGIQIPLITTNDLGQTISLMPDQYQITLGAQAAVEELINNDFNSDQRNAPGVDGAAYERREMTTEERDKYTKRHAAKIGQIQANSGIILPETQAMLHRISGSLDHAVLTNKTDAESEQLRNDLSTIAEMAAGSGALNGLLVESMSPENYGRMKSAQKAFKDPRVTAQSYGKQLQNESVNADNRARTALGSESGNRGAAGKTGGGTNDDYANELKRGDLSSARSTLQDLANENSFLIWNKGKNNEVIDRDLKLHYDDYLSRNSNPGKASVQEDARNYAAGKVFEQGAYVRTKDGKEFLNGLREAERTAQAAGYKDLDHFIRDTANNTVTLEEIKDQGQLSISKNNFRGGNAITQNVSEIIDNEDGSISLLFPSEDGGQPYRHVINLPDPDDILQKPVKVQEDMARGRYGESIVNEDEIWKEQTGHEHSPRELYHQEIRREIIQDDSSGEKELWALADAAGVPRRAKRGTSEGIFHFSDLEPFVTDEMIYERVSPETYSNQVALRQEDAVNKQVRHMRAMDTMLDPDNPTNHLSQYQRVRRKGDKQNTEITELENTTSTRYLAGGTLAEQQELFRREQQEHDKLAAAHRAAQIAAIKSNLK